MTTKTSLYPTIEQFEPREAGKRDWGQELIVAETDKYLGKRLTMKPGSAGGFQYHVEKDETFYMVSGNAYVDYVEHGELQTTVMLPGQAYRIPPGAPHRVRAITECVFFEVSTPHHDDRVRVEEEFGIVPTTPGLPSTR